MVTNDDSAPCQARTGVKIKASGDIQVLENTGDTMSGFFGNAQFVSKHLLHGTMEFGEFTAFVDLKGGTLTMNVLTRYNNGSIRRDTITAVLQQKR